MGRVKLTKGGVLSNLDLTMDPEKRRQAIKDERAAAIMDEAINDAKKHGGDSFKVAHTDEVASGFQFDKTRHHDKTDREAGQEWMQPLGIVVGRDKPNGWGWSVTPQLADAVEQGYKCPNCLQAVDPSQSVCTWLYPRDGVPIKGCGFSWIADQTIGWKAAEEIRRRK